MAPRRLGRSRFPSSSRTVVEEKTSGASKFMRSNRTLSFSYSGRRQIRWRELRTFEVPSGLHNHSITVIPNVGGSRTCLLEVDGDPVVSCPIEVKDGFVRLTRKIYNQLGEDALNEEFLIQTTAVLLDLFMTYPALRLLLISHVELGVPVTVRDDRSTVLLSTGQAVIDTATTSWRAEAIRRLRLRVYNESYPGLSLGLIREDSFGTFRLRDWLSVQTTSYRAHLTLTDPVIDLGRGRRFEINPNALFQLHDRYLEVLQCWNHAGRIRESMGGETFSDMNHFRKFNPGGDQNVHFYGLDDGSVTCHDDVGTRYFDWSFHAKAKLESEEHDLGVTIADIDVDTLEWTVMAGMHDDMAISLDDVRYYADQPCYSTINTSKGPIPVIGRIHAVRKISETRPRCTNGYEYIFSDLPCHSIPGGEKLRRVDREKLWPEQDFVVPFEPDEEVDFIVKIITVYPPGKYIFSNINRHVDGVGFVKSFNPDPIAAKREEEYMKLALKLFCPWSGLVDHVTVDGQEVIDPFIIATGSNCMQLSGLEYFDIPKILASPQGESIRVFCDNFINTYMPDAFNSCAFISVGPNLFMIPDDNPEIGESQIRQQLYRIILCKYGAVMSEVKVRNQNHFDTFFLPVSIMSDNTNAKILTPWNFAANECAVYRFENPMFAGKRGEWHKISYTNSSGRQIVDLPVWNGVSVYSESLITFAGSFDTSEYLSYERRPIAEFSEDGEILESKDESHMNINLHKFLRDLPVLLSDIVQRDIAEDVNDYEEEEKSGDRTRVLKYTFRLPFIHCVFCAVLTKPNFVIRILHLSLFPSRTDYLNRSRSMNRYLGFAGRVESLNPSGESMISAASAALERFGSS